MSSYPLHTQATAPEGSKPLLATVEKKYGFIPNLLAAFAESPAVLSTYLEMGMKISESNFTATEQDVLFLTISKANDCHYCLAAHSAIAKMGNMSQDLLAQLRGGQELDDPKLNALAKCAASITDKRGWLAPEEVGSFFAAGYSKEDLLNVLLAVSMKTLSNYFNHLGDTPLDAAFSDFRVLP